MESEKEYPIVMLFCAIIFIISSPFILFVMLIKYLFTKQEIGQSDPLDDRPSTPCPPFVSISIPNNKNIIKK